MIKKFSSRETTIHISACQVYRSLELNWHQPTASHPQHLVQKCNKLSFKLKTKLFVKINKGQKCSNFLVFFVGHLNKGICLIHFRVIPPLMETSHEFPDFPLYQIYTFNLFFQFFWGRSRRGIQSLPAHLLSYKYRQMAATDICLNEVSRNN